MCNNNLKYLKEEQSNGKVMFVKQGNIHYLYLGLLVL